MASPGVEVVVEPRTTWHRVVLAEFAATVLIVGASPILTVRNASQGAAAGEAVSLAGPLVRLTAVCLLFFVLALMAGGRKAGKVAAAFGALVLLGALLNATDELTLLGKALTAPSSAGSPSPGSPGGGGAPAPKAA